MPRSGAYDYASKILDNDHRKHFLGLETLDRRTVWINLARVATCTLLSVFDMSDPRISAPPVRFVAHLADCKEPFELEELPDTWILNVGMYLDEFGNLENRFVSFPSEDADLVSINGDLLIFMEYPTEWVEEADLEWKRHGPRGRQNALAGVLPLKERRSPAGEGGAKD